MTRQDYEQRFRLYPDVATITEFCAMLCIGDTCAGKLLRKNLAGRCVIRHSCYIPKEKSSNLC